jgi:hypothetical protein
MSDEDIFKNTLHWAVHIQKNGLHDKYTIRDIVDMSGAPKLGLADRIMNGERGSRVEKKKKLESLWLKRNS